MREHLTEDLGLLANSGIAGLGLFLDSFQALRDMVRVRDEQLELELLEVAPRVARAGKAVRDSKERIDLPKTSQEGRTGAGHILDPHCGGCQLPRADERADPLQPVVGDRRHADVRLVRLRCVRGDLRPGLRERVEERGLPRIGEPDDADLECHGGQA